VSHIVLCSNVETGIGCIASSIPSLRHFTQRKDGSNTYEYSDKRSGRMGFFSVGNAALSTTRKHEGASDMGISLSTVRGRSDEQWQRIRDGDSDHSTKPMNTNKIYAVHTYTVEHDDKMSQKALTD
jgi:hypothetical protein